MECETACLYLGQLTLMTLVSLIHDCQKHNYDAYSCLLEVADYACTLKLALEVLDEHSWQQIGSLKDLLEEADVLTNSTTMGTHWI